MSEVKFYRLDKGVEYNDSPLRIPAGTIVVTAFAHAEAMNALQARLAQCEGELLGARILEQDVRQERDAALEACAEMAERTTIVLDSTPNWEYTVQCTKAAQQIRHEVGR